MLKKTLWVVVLILLGAALWYLLLKPQDYLAILKVNASPGTINQTVKLWSKTLENSQIVKQDALSDFEQRLTFNDSIFTYKWKIEPLNDSISKINISILDNQNSLKIRSLMPFSEIDFEKRSKKTVYEFHERLNEHLEKFKITQRGLDSIADSYCAYVPVQCTQIEKAGEMMKNYPLLDGFILNSKIETTGQPFIEITDWNIEEDKIRFNFCYPIVKSDSLPKHEIIRYKQFNGGKALRATYNGNYITSDRAWYSLLREAEKKELEVTERPVEVFFTNPNMATNELEWVAEIYMPLAD